MAKITSKEYDIVYPSPIPLRELSAIAVAIELWRLDLKHYLKNVNFEIEFYNDCSTKPRITLRDLILDAPSVIDQITKIYIESLISSTNGWLRYNFECI